MNNLRDSVRNILKDNNIYADKSLGQNFLINESVCCEIVDKANINIQDTIVEVGAGFGTLTKLIAQKANRVIAVEKSLDMVNILRNEVKEFSNVEVVHKDILKFNPTEYGLDAFSYKLVGAPPYYITARLFRTFLQNIKESPSSITLLIQKEVAEKIAKKEPPFSLLGVSVRVYGDVSISKRINKNVFYPAPSIESRIILVNNIKKPKVDEKIFFQILRMGFANPRKKILKNISVGMKQDKNITQEIFKSTFIDIDERPGDLSIKQWIDLTKNI